MRTTLTIDDDVLAVARALAQRNGTSVGRALSELARRGLKASPAGSKRDTVFDVTPGAGPITSEDVYRALSDWP